MRRVLPILLILTFTGVDSPASQVTDAKKIEKTGFFRPTNSNITQEALLSSKPPVAIKPIEKRKFLKGVIIIKLTLSKIKKGLRKSASIDKLVFHHKEKKPFRWHWGGFFLGLFLPFIGLLIAGIIRKDDRKRDRIDSAAIATAIVSLILIVIVLKGISGSL